jgi:hypothetical protein
MSWRKSDPDCRDSAIHFSRIRWRSLYAHQPLQVPFVQHNNMVEQISSAVSHPALGNAILPWAAERSSFRLDAKALHDVDNFFVKAGSPIKNQILRR